MTIDPNKNSTGSLSSWFSMEKLPSEIWTLGERIATSTRDHFAIEHFNSLANSYLIEPIASICKRSVRYITIDDRESSSERAYYDSCESQVALYAEVLKVAKEKGVSRRDYFENMKEGKLNKNLNATQMEVIEEAKRNLSKREINYP